ncbi:NADH-quinone oxidoreductase subunit NuoK [Dyadobacter chenwenxiniae]|uniref:NADH-quinone oxidoreductase subunit K n=1 Tax=Dyadobacter chenwenxiniae TaxID=2906456 RepID=A0A9X1PJG2_9BACT|nr:NADH-quinone oxidoreductase subunit NuoK [Dyadobacter chenwenxiniae]MCF0061988.1 NADH-quinone oxidoreductase subunit NuoK [Dyadobacter chenwenxiniae]UON81799.1 NADH-quinone oxidoreductase subunit NuoK [Dyadobacter chenwenxiniae]
MTYIPIHHYLIVAAALFCIGLAIAITKRHFIGILLGIELMLNAVNINLVAFSRYDPERLSGQLFALFVIVVAAAEVTIALAIILRVYGHYQTVDPDEVDQLKK